MTNPEVPDSMDYSELDDDALIRELRAGGDERAFRELYRRHTPRLYQMVLRALASVEDAEDVVQDAWIRAVRSLDCFRGDARFATWLTAIAVNRIGDRIRRDKRWVFDDVPLEQIAASRSVDVEMVDIEHALAALPLGYRTIVLLHDVEGYTHEEIAVQLGVTVGTSKSQLFHGRRVLREMLEQVEETKDV